MAMISLSAITTDPSLQHRLVGSAYREHVADLTQLLQEDSELELNPVDIVSDGDQMWLWDGHQRLEAYQAAGRGTIPARVIEADKMAAFDLSLSANSNHGLMRTKEEVHSLLAKVFSDTRHKEKSEREMARLARVTRHAVRNFKRFLEHQNATPSTLEVDSAPQEETAEAAPAVNPEVALRERRLATLKRAYRQLVKSLDEVGLFDAVQPHLAAIKAAACI